MRTATFLSPLLVMLLTACASGKASQTETAKAPESASSAASGGTDCSLEVALSCAEGAKDGCLLKHPNDAARPLTLRHVCVPPGGDAGAPPCTQEIAKICGAGFKDACLLTPPAADIHVCVQSD